MSKWVKFSDRLPTEADADLNKKVIVKKAGGSWYIAYLSEVCRCTYHYADHFWLANVPKPRTLEDVVREYVDTGKPQRVLDLLKEMKEFIGVE